MEYYNTDLINVDKILKERNKKCTIDRQRRMKKKRRKSRMKMERYVWRYKN